MSTQRADYNTLADVYYTDASNPSPVLAYSDVPCRIVPATTIHSEATTCSDLTRGYITTDLDLTLLFVPFSAGAIFSSFVTPTWFGMTFTEHPGRIFWLTAKDVSTPTGAGLYRRYWYTDKPI